MMEEEEARAWWAQRESRAEAELAGALQRRMEAQRAQVLAFKTEQSKWEHELQLRISKYAHDRKLLTEHNVELQEQLRALELRLVQQQRDADAQVARVIELEGMLNDCKVDAQQIKRLQERNDALEKQVQQWERLYTAEQAAAAKQRETLQDELLDYLERKLEVQASQVDPPQAQSKPEPAPAPTEEPVRELRSLSRTASWSDGLREKMSAPKSVSDLEKACKQKDQTIHSLKTLVERQEAVFDEKLKLMSAKYNQAKAINLALQKQMLESMTEAEGKQSGH